MDTLTLINKIYIQYYQEGTLIPHILEELVTAHLSYKKIPGVSNVNLRIHAKLMRIKPRKQNTCTSMGDTISISQQAINVQYSLQSNRGSMYVSPAILKKGEIFSIGRNFL